MTAVAVVEKPSCPSANKRPRVVLPETSTCSQQVSHDQALKKGLGLTWRSQNLLCIQAMELEHLGST